MSPVVRVLTETAKTREPMRWVFTYFHPVDECSNGGSSWEVVTQEFAPGLILHTHPCCSRCGVEPIVDDFRSEPDPGFVPWRTVQLSPQD